MPPGKLAGMLSCVGFCPPALEVVTPFVVPSNFHVITPSLISFVPFIPFK